MLTGHAIGYRISPENDEARHAALATYVAHYELLQIKIVMFISLPPEKNSRGVRYKMQNPRILDRASHGTLHGVGVLYSDIRTFASWVIISRTSSIFTSPRSTIFTPSPHPVDDAHERNTVTHQLKPSPI